MEVSGLLADLNDAQHRAVTSTAAPLCILAGAGTGKTRVLTRRIAWRCASGSADPRHVLALTFTRKAAGELWSRLRRLGLRDAVTSGTFHSVAFAQLRQRWLDTGTPAPTLLDQKGRLLVRLVPRVRRPQVTIADYAGEIEWAKARIVTPERYAEAAIRAGRRPPVDPDAMATIYRRYEDEKQTKRLVDFDDLLWQCARTIETVPDFAAAQRWRFRHLFVDEFQDVNPLQLRLLEGWRGGSADLCVVGDPNQAIYGWNGADATALVRFAERWPGSAVVALEENHRSSPQVLAVANAVLAAGAPERLLRLRATRPDGPIPRVHPYPTDTQEAKGIARAALDLHGPGTPWSHQAVLVRTHAQTVLLEQAFKLAGVPFRLRGKAAFLDLPEVRQALRSLERSRTFLGGLAALDAEVADLAARDDAGDAEADRVATLEELLRLATEYQTQDPAPSAAGFAGWLAATVRAEEAAAGGNVVEIGTFHAAKGLEWPIVHLAGLESGLVPITHARTADALAEERRLLYVAVTRAERMLSCSWAQQRTFGMRESTRSPSPYLHDVDQVIAALEAGARPDDWRPHVARQRDALRRVAPRSRRAEDGLDADGEAAFAALKQWRSGAARAAGVPAYVIFHDSTLVALAETRPRDQRGLLAVPGIGPVKASRFGPDVLSVLAGCRG